MISVSRKRKNGIISVKPGKVVKSRKSVAAKAKKRVVKSKLKGKRISHQRGGEDILLFAEENIKVVKDKSSLADQSPKLVNIEVSSTQININKSGIQSPHLVDLKKQEVIIQSKEEKYYKPSFEDRLANWESKLVNPKANFITPAAVKHAKVTCSRSLSKMRRLVILSVFRLTSVFDKSTDKFARWGDAKTTAYLNRISDRNLAKQDKQEDIAVFKELEFPDQVGVSPKKYRFFYLLAPREVTVSLSLFIVLALSLVLPIKAFTFYSQVKEQGAKVLGVSSNVYEDVNAGWGAFSSLDFGVASDNFLAASDHLLDIKEVINEYPSFLISLAKIVPEVGDKLVVASALVEVANYLTQTGAIMSQVLGQITATESTPTAKLVNLKQGFGQMNYMLTEANGHLQGIKIFDVPGDYQEKVQLLKVWLPVGLGILDKAMEVIDFSIIFLGHNEPQRYLIVFQNSNELRPTGGFMGTIAEVDLRYGIAERIYIPPGGIYDMQGDLEVLLESPKPLHMLNANWQMQDANWFFDFPTSAQKVIWFYEKSGGPTVDGLVAINSNLLPELLAVTGPIYLENFDVILDEYNVIARIQEEVEINYDKELNQPKKIISDLIPEILTRLQNLQGYEFLELFNMFSSALDTRDIQLYHQTDAMQEKITALGWSGEVKSTDQDYLAVVNTNIGGDKSDGVIDQQIYLQTEINEDGQIINHLEVTKEHLGNILDPFINEEHVDYLRIYVPLGSKLLAAQGFYEPLPQEFSSPSSGFREDDYLRTIEAKPIVDEQTGTRMTEEFGKTVFANYVKVKPGESTTVSITYSLPTSLEFKNEGKQNMVAQYFDKFVRSLGFSINDYQEVAMYTSFWQKQSGQNNTQIVHELRLPQAWAVSVSPSLQDKIAQDNGNIYFQADLLKDAFWGVILSR